MVSNYRPVFDPAYLGGSGYLYDWVTAQGLADSCVSVAGCTKPESKVRGICPEGWRIPSRADISTIRAYLAAVFDPTLDAPYINVAYLLKSTRSWGGMRGDERDPYFYAGFDPVGFNAVPGGRVSSTGGYSYLIDDKAQFEIWLADEFSATQGNNFYILGSQPETRFQNPSKIAKLPLRCVRN